MRKQKGVHRRSPWRGGGWVLSAALLTATITGCGDLLDAENPNSIKQEDLARAASAEAAVNGAFGTVTRGVIAMWGPYSTATDEVTWIGSRDAWQRLDFGFINEPANEFSDDAFKVMAEGRWLADEAIRLLEGFDAEGVLPSETDLARAYLYGAIAYITIADQFDRYVFSDRSVSENPPLDPMQMDQLYRTAIDYINRGMPIAQAEEDAMMERNFIALRARAFQSLGIWQKVNPQGNVADDPLVQSAEAVADAMRALELGAGEPDWKYQLDPANEEVAIAFEVSLPYNINQRKELNIGSSYVAVDEDGDITGVVLMDPINNIPDPVIAARVADFSGGTTLVPFTVVSAREMLLIIAEDALARGDMATFTANINKIRALNSSLSPYTGQVPAMDMLMHARRVNLFLQARRLADHYRFRNPAPLWQSGSSAIQSPGTFFPITITECRANPLIGEGNCNVP